MPDAIRVLYVDDEPSLLDIGKLFLEKTGDFTIDTLTSAAEALLQLKTKRYDVIVSDYQMPDMDGIEFLKQLKASENSTPFIIFTGRGRENVVIEALNEGADFYLQKGGEPKSQFAELSNKIRYAVTRKRAEEALLRKNEELFASYEQIAAAEDELRTNLDKLTRQEMALKESEVRYRSIVNDQTEMIARFTPDGAITFVNEAYRLFFASLLDIKDVTGHNIRDVLQVKNYTDVEKFLHSLTQQIPIREIELVFKERDGNLHWQIWSVRALFNTDGSPVEYQIVGRDITEIKRQKKTEHELRRNEQRSLAVILNAGSWIWEVDPEGVYRYSTPAVEQILGYTLDELVGKMHFYDLFDPSFQEGLKEATSAAFSRREPFRHFENLNRHRNGTPVVLNTSGIPVFEEDGTFSGYCGIDEDITKRKATDSAFQAIVRSMVGSTGLNSLRKITENVSSWLGADCVMVGEIQPDNQTVKVLSMLLDGKEISDFSYTLKGSPCNDVAERGFCLYPDNVIELFPESKDLVELNIRGYIGTPLRNSSGQVCGILSALFRNPIHSSPSMQEILDIISVKASAEIERSQMEHALRESQQRLAEAMDLAHLVNWQFDVRKGMFTFDDRFYALYGTTGEREGGNQMSAEEYAKRFLHPDDQNLVIDEVNKALQATDPGYTSLVGHRIIRRDGEIRHIIVRFGITKDENGRTIKTHGANQDITELMRMENALRESEERYRQLVENLNDIIYKVDQNGVITYVSPVVERQYGYSSSDLLEKPFMDVVFKDDIPNLQKRFAEMRTGIIVPFEWRLKHKDGSLSWVRSSTRPVLDVHGTSGFLGIVSDITREKQTEQALRESEARARAMILAIPDMVFRMDRQGIFLDYKADISDLYVQSEPTIIGRRNREITPPEFADLIDVQIRTVLETGTTQTFEYELPIPGRGVRNYEARMVASGLNEVTAIIRDITERKRAEAALAESESFNRGLVENLPEYLCVYGSDGILLYVNPASANAWGFEADEMVGTHILTYIPKEYRELVTANMTDRQKGSDISPYEIDIITKNGIRRSVIVKATPIKYQKNPAILLLLIDITERKRVEDALNMANKKLNILSSITRHDINNQLAVLVGYLRILEKKQPDPLLNVYSQKVSTAAQRISAMIQFTKEYEQVGVKAPAWLDCRALVDTVTKDVSLGQVKVKNALTSNTEVLADPLIVKVFYNLVDNAVCYGGKITTIRFSFEECDDNQIIVCEDDGDGVLADEKEKIFDWGIGKNTGLGLALSREILDITCITIIETGEPGKGARFEMTVPKGMWRAVDVDRKVKGQGT